MTIPHVFPSLVDGPVQVVLIAGSGLSTPNVPMLSGLRGKLEEIAQSLAVSVTLAPSNEQYDYELAGAVIVKLQAGDKTEPESRLWLAEELGILDDRRWFGEIGLPLSGNTPRHRAIARFAVEERLMAIVSLNWDTLLEAALDSVGLADGTAPSRPWRITARVSAINDTHMPNLGHANIFPVIKPHGCVRNLEQARRQFRSTGTAPSVIFKLTKTELGSLTSEQKTLIDTDVQGYIAKCPLIAIGWKAGEDYLRNTVAKTAKAAQHTVQDAFTLVDLCWDENHTEIATAYGKNSNEVFAEVGKVWADAQPTTDCLFQWLQARYALNKLKAASPPPHQAALQLLLQQLDQPAHGHFILRWVDSWLHTWVRLCWRAGVVQGNDPHTGLAIEPWDIPIMPRDVHVPIGTMTGARRELKAAAKLLAVLGNDLSRFNFEKFPGGFWDEDTWSLYIPLPGWRGTAQPADLAALKPLIEALRGIGFVRNIHLVRLDTAAALPDQAYYNQLSAQVGQLMPLEKFARSDALTWIDLEALKGGPR